MSAEEAAWIRVQRKTFTRWCNNFLVNRNLAMNVLELDIADGVALHALLEILSNESIQPPPKKNARLKLQKVENINLSLRYIKSKDIKLVGIGAEDIFDGKTSLILGLIWTLILRFQIVGQDEGPMDSAKQALLDWCNRVLNPQGISVKNFKSDWQDGRAFCGLCNALQENSIDLNACPPEHAETNLNHAFNTAEQLFNFPKVLDAIDVIENPDDLSNMTYISYFRGYMSANTACAAKCFAEGLGLTQAITNRPASFNVTCCNEDGEHATRGGANVRSFLRDANGKDLCKVQIADNRNGTYTCTYVCPTPCVAELHVQIGKDLIKDAPFSPKVEPGEPDPSKCVCSGPGIEQAIAGEPTQFFIQTKDCNGNNLPQGGANITATLQDPTGEIPVTIHDNKDGTYNASYTPKTADNIKLNVIVSTEHYGNGHTQGSPYGVQVTPGHPDASKTYAFGPGTEGAVSGELSEITVQCVDAFDNKLSQGGSPVNARLSINGEEAKPVSVNDNGDGTYTLSYTPTATGNYVIPINLGSHPIRNSPIDVTILPGMYNPLNFTWDDIQLDADGRRVVVAGVEDTFMVTARDSYGNPLTIGGLNVQGRIEGGPVAVEAKTVDKENGTYVLSYVPEKTGLYTFTALVDDVKLGGSTNPFPFMCVPAGPCAENTVAYGPGVSAAQVGKENVFTVEAHDLFDNVLTEGGAEVGGQLTPVGGDELAVPVVVVDNGDGTYACSYPGLVKAGEYELVPTLSGQPVKGAPFHLAVDPGDVSVDNTQIQFPDVNISGLDGPIITLRDDQLNTRKTGGDRVVAEIKRKTRLPPVKAHPKDDGSFEVEYPANLKGNYEADVTVNEKPAPGGPWNLNIEEGSFSDEHKEKIEQLLAHSPPQARAALFRLLNGASEKEREKMLQEMTALSSL